MPFISRKMNVMEIEWYISVFNNCACDSILEMSERIWHCKKDVWREFIEEKVGELMSYEGEPIDDWEEFISEHEMDNEICRIVRVMSPVGQELYFLVTASSNSNWASIELLHDTWEK